MRKKFLLSLPKIKANKEIINAAKGDQRLEKLRYGHSDYYYLIKEYYIAKVYNGILKVAVFTRDDVLREKPTYEIYISKKENQYLTYDTTEEKWRTAKIDNLFGYFYYEQKRYYSKGTEKTIIDYLNNESKTGYGAILTFQDEIKERQLKAQHNRITNKIDAAMELVPKLPKNFYSWAEDVAMIHSRYIYYYYQRNVKEGYCTHCKTMVPITSPKHNTAGKCSKCKSEITFKAIKKAAVVRDEGYASIFQRTKEGFIFRYFEINKKYQDYQNPEYWIRETIRIFHDNNYYNTGEYEWTEFKNTGLIRWCNRGQRRSYYGYHNNYVFLNPSTLYSSNLKKVFKDTIYQYSAIDLFAKGLHGERFYPGTYLEKYKNYKFIEYLVKLKLYNLTQDFIEGYSYSTFNTNGKRIHEVLKISKEQLKMLISMNANAGELSCLQMANEEGIKLTKEQIHWINKNRGIDRIIKFMRYSTPHKVIRYIKEQSKSSKRKPWDTSHDYYDYLDASLKLGYDLNNEFVFFPRRLSEAHDLVMEEWELKQESIEKMKDDERNIEMEKIAEELVKKYSMKDKHFSIRIPWTCEEIRNEGQQLHHCVGTYVKRILTKETSILFIRKIDDIDTPYYTIEVQDNSIVQVRGKNNCSPTKEVQAFVEKFKKKKLHKQLEREAV